jgi:RNA polymerase sigma factor (sigma-70 family)
MTAPLDSPAPPAAVHPDDADAVRASTTDPDRFGVIFDRYFAEIHRYVARRLGTAVADDVAAETFLQAFRQRGRYDAGRGNVRAWLYGIATNLVGRHRRGEVRAYRAWQRLDHADGTVSAGHEDLVAARVSAERAQARLGRALAALAAGDRDVLLLVALAGLTYDETAVALGVAYGTVCSRLSRARRHLRAALADLDPTFDRENDSDG